MLHDDQDFDDASDGGETTPLLRSKQDADAETTWAEALVEFRKLLSTSLTVTAGYLLQQSLQITSIFIIGKLGPLELSIAAFSYMIANTTAWLLAIGGTTAIDSVGATAFGRGHDLTVIGVLLQKYLLTTAIFFVPVALLWSFCGPVLALCHVPLDLAYGSQAFLRCMLPFAVGYILFEALKKYMQCQNIITPSAVILATSAAINVPLSYVLVHTLGWGILGGAVATGSMYWLSAILAYCYIRFVDGMQAWGGWSPRACLQDTAAFARLVLMGVVSMGAEWWAFEVISITAGSMGSAHAAAQSALMTTDTLLALFPFGVGIATTSVVGQLLGSGQPKRARTVARMASGLAVCNGTVVMLVMMLFRRNIAQLFTDDQGIIDLAVEAIPWAAAFQVSDGLQAVNAGALRALSRVTLAAQVNLVAYYVLAIPVCFLLAFKAGLGLAGLWMGLALSLTVAGTVEFVVVALVDWERFGVCGV